MAMAINIRSNFLFLENNLFIDWKQGLTMALA